MTILLSFLLASQLIFRDFENSGFYSSSAISVQQSVSDSSAADPSNAQSITNSSKHLSDKDFESAIINLSGASCLEELSESEIERYQELSERPINLNHCSKAQLQSSSIFSPYQIASLLEYRSTHGEILSYSELALIGGFNAQLAESLRPFTTLASRSPIAQRPSKQFHQSTTLSASLREDLSYTGKMKLNASYADKIDFLYSNRNTYSKPKFGWGEISAAYYGNSAISKIILGKFSARFGQGLLSWSGFSLSSFSSISAFSRNPSGFSPTSAADSPLLGLAAECNIASLVVAAGYSFSNASYFARVSRDWTNFSLNLNAAPQGLSLDWRYSLKNLSLFSELAYYYANEAAFLAGLLYTPQYGKSFALQARIYPKSSSKYSGLALGMDIPNCFASVEAGYRLDKKMPMIKGLVVYKFSLDNLNAKLQWNERYRPDDKYPLRSELRLELSYPLGIWQFSGRGNLSYCHHLGQLYYIQLGPKTEKAQLSCRLCYFNIPFWDDRIYVYQQDAPGNFNIPAFSGKGLNASIFAAYHLNKSHSIWLRFEGSEKKHEIRLQYRLKI